MLRLVLLLVVAGSLTACSQPAEEIRFDVLIVDGTVYDGSMSEPRRTNIGVVAERIASIGAPADAAADLVIDAAGRVVVPGFIDPHTHTAEDLASPERKANVNFLTQGVATVFVGVDGGGLPDRGDAITAMQSQGIGTNVAFYAGHAEIRRRVMGLENRAPTEEELQRMREHVADEMRAGALGLSTGLFYTPGNYATTEEVIELAKVAAGYGGVYDSHLRDEASYTIGLQGAVREAIRIGEEADIAVHIAHIKALGRSVWGQSGDVIALVAAANERGVEVTADQYPYRASGTSLASSLIPRWAMADSREAMLGRLANPDLEDRLREEMDANLWRRGGAESLLITGESGWRGMTLEEIAAEMGVEPLDAAIEVVREGDPSVASFNMNPDDMSAFAIQPWVMTGSDGSGGHPRKYGTYPQAYRDFVREQALFSTSRFVHRSSGLPADTFGLCDRGYLEEGRRADIVVIDLDNFVPLADFENPTELSTGVTDMLVNGQAVIANGEYTGALPGVVVDRQHLECND